MKKRLLLSFFFGYFSLNRRFDDFDTGVVGNFDNETVVFNIRDDAVDAARRDDVVAGSEGLEHLSVLLLLLALRGDEEKPHSAKKKDHDDELATDTACSARWSSVS